MAKYPIFTSKDLDGFFGLFVDNLVQLLLIVSLCSVCGIGANSDLLLRAILPGAGISILLGNVFYAIQAHLLARKEGRDDVTALPYGLNTPSLLVYIFLVMLPAYNQATSTGTPNADAARLAWQAGVVACLGSGLIEFVGAFAAGWVRRRTPRAALLSTLAGIAIGFISMTFALQIFQRPVVAMLPLAIILLTYFSKLRFPLGIPGGLLAVLVGTLCAWSFPFFLPDSIVGPAMSGQAVADAWQLKGVYLPQFVGKDIWTLIQAPSNWLPYLAVIIPMGLFNVVGSLQNIESAEAAGDTYPTAPSLAVNGLGTIVGALFGSCFPTTIYIGHPGWKDMGARAGYSTLNGLVIATICLTGTVTLISTVIPVEAGVAIVMWIGVIITAQAFQATNPLHAPAVAIGFFPAIAAWGATLVRGSFAQAQGRTVQQLLS
ncbi:MAG: NCS2 family permease, partial [Planctomycetota bacterium]